MRIAQVPEPEMDVNDHVVVVQLIISSAGFLATATIALFGWLISRNTSATKDKLGEVAANVDGNLSDVKDNLAQVKQIADAFAAEVVRLQEKGTTTPYGAPSTENPVTLSAGLPVTQGSSRNPKNGE